MKYFPGITAVTPILMVVLGQVALGGEISGRVVNATTKRPLEFVNVLLMRLPDSSMAVGTATGTEGRFIFPQVTPGRYYARCFFVGFTTLFTRAFVVDSLTRRVSLGTLHLSESAVPLDEVVVSREKSVQMNAIDRKVYNVDQDLMSKSGSASDLLQNVPSVQVDIDGNVSLRGSSDVQILIDGRNSPLMGRNRAEVLQQIPANTIERIEVMTNPSARYTPEGTSGIINLVLKQTRDTGINGSVTGNAGNQGRYNGTLVFNYRPGTFNLFGSYAYRRDSRNRITSDVRSGFGPVAQNYREDLGSYADPASHIAALGLDMEFDPSTKAGVSGRFFQNKYTRTESAQTLLQNANFTPVEGYNRERLNLEDHRQVGGMAFFEHKFPTEDHHLRVEYQYSNHDEREDNTFTETYWLPALAFDRSATLIHPFEREQQVTLEYADPLSEATSLEAGYAGEFNHGDYDFTVRNFDAGRQDWLVDPGKTNRFIVDENLNALYATLRHSFGSLGMLGGVRAERSSVGSNQVSRGITNLNSYWSFYPTLHLSWALSPTTEIQLNYSRRVHRPEVDDLNPFPEYSDPRNLSAGNPLLMPERIHSVECGVKLQDEQFSLVPSVYYRYTANRFSSLVTALNDSVLLTTRDNLTSGQAAGIEVVLSYDLGQVWTAHANLNTYFDEIDGSNLGYGTRKSVVTWAGALTMSVTPMRGTMVQLNTHYHGTRLTAQGEMKPSYVVNLGIRQEILKSRLALTLTVADIFQTARREMTLDTPVLNQTVIRRRDSGIIYLGFSYRFGSGTDEEQDDQIEYENGV